MIGENSKSNLLAISSRSIDLDLGRDDCVIRVRGFTFCIDGIRVAGKPAYEDWALAMQVLGTVNRRIVKPFKLWVCEMLLHGSASYGEMYTQAMQETGLSYQTLANSMSVVRRYQLPDGSIKWHSELSFSHHEIVAALPVDEREEWLQKCERENLSTDELREVVKKGGKAKRYEFCCPTCGTTYEVGSPVVIKRTIKRGKGVK